HTDSAFEGRRLVARPRRRAPVGICRLCVRSPTSNDGSGARRARTCRNRRGARHATGSTARPLRIASDPASGQSLGRAVRRGSAVGGLGVLPPARLGCGVVRLPVAVLAGEALPGAPCGPVRCVDTVAVRRRAVGAAMTTRDVTIAGYVLVFAAGAVV